VACVGYPALLGPALEHDEDAARHLAFFPKSRYGRGRDLLAATIECLLAAAPVHYHASSQAMQRTPSSPVASLCRTTTSLRPG